MTKPFLSFGLLQRRLTIGTTEELRFQQGVNILVGPPNTGKTRWLQTLDFLLGDSGENPFDGAEENGLAEKYEGASVEMCIGEEVFLVSRSWNEAGVRTKVAVDGIYMDTKSFQRFLFEKLGIPVLNFPRGNPMSGQTWPELSFRVLLRHIHRQQRFWSGLVDQQADAEQHASLLQFLGIAERVYTVEYGALVELKLKVDRLKSQRDQHKAILDELARDILSQPQLIVGASRATVDAASAQLAADLDALNKKRELLIEKAKIKALRGEVANESDRLSTEVGATQERLGRSRGALTATEDRLRELRGYLTGIQEEAERLTRAQEAGEVFADLRVTHCPACDQAVAATTVDEGQCFLCHQSLANEPVLEGLGVVRLRFELDRLRGEQKETADLLAVVEKDVRKHKAAIAEGEERLRSLYNRLTPMRQSVSTLVQSDVSAVDMAIGELNERQRQLGRVSAALVWGAELTDRIAQAEKDIVPLQAKMDEYSRAVDYDAAAAKLEDGMNAYLTAINVIRPNVWRHSKVRVELSRSSATFKVGSRRWLSTLGGTDQLYFLMAYQYGLLSLSADPECHYPGLTIIDIPGEFSGVAVEDKEDFIVRPFIDLLGQEENAGTQAIITGAAFSGLKGVTRISMTETYVA